MSNINGAPGTRRGTDQLRGDVGQRVGRVEAQSHRRIEVRTGDRAKSWISNVM